MTDNSRPEKPRLSLRPRAAGTAGAAGSTTVRPRTTLRITPRAGAEGASTVHSPRMAGTAPAGRTPLRMPHPAAPAAGQAGTAPAGDRPAPKPRGRKGGRQKPDITGWQPRAIAAEIVASVIAGHPFRQIVQQGEHIMDPRDVALCSEIAYGTLRHFRWLEFNLRPYLQNKQKLQPVVKALLLTGLYQLGVMKTPDYAVVNAMVGATYRLYYKRCQGLVNAVLRNFIRNGGELQQSAVKSINLSCPEWMWVKIVTTYPKEQALDIAAKSNERGPMFLRVQTSRINTNAYVKKLEEEGIEVKRSEESGMIELASPVSVTKLPGFDQGLVCVQDLAAQRPVQLLDLEEGKKLSVLDCCCAPGGKSAQILNAASDLTLTACDTSLERLETTVRNLQRLGYIPAEKTPVVVPYATFDDPGASAIAAEALKDAVAAAEAKLRGEEPAAPAPAPAPAAPAAAAAPAAPAAEGAEGAEQPQPEVKRYQPIGHIKYRSPADHTVIEADLGEIKPELVKEGDRVRLMQLNAANLSPEAVGTFDRILVDAPCSGSGVIRRHPDIKWLRRYDDVTVLCKLQAEILDAAFACLKSGGIMVYSTCSVLRQENKDQVEAFLSRHADAKLLPFEEKGEQVEMMQRFPGDDGGDGFFYARFVKA